MATAVNKPYVPPHLRGLTKEFVTVPFPPASKNCSLLDFEYGGQAYVPLFVDGPIKHLGSEGFQIPFIIESDAMGMNCYRGRDNSIENQPEGLIDSVTFSGLSIERPLRVLFLMNCAWGEAGSTIGNIQLSFVDGSSSNHPIVVGSNIRDHFAGGFCNHLDSAHAFNVFKCDTHYARLDTAVILLPQTTPTLVEMTFTAAGRKPQGVPIFVAVTVEHVITAISAVSR